MRAFLFFAFWFVCFLDFARNLNLKGVIGVAVCCFCFAGFAFFCVAFFCVALFVLLLLCVFLYFSFFVFVFIFVFISVSVFFFFLVSALSLRLLMLCFFCFLFLSALVRSRVRSQLCKRGRGLQPVSPPWLTASVLWKLFIWRALPSPNDLTR